MNGALCARLRPIRSRGRAGQMHVERHRQGDRVEEFSDDATWELMYFGHAR
jgi:hypothetical protein